MTEILAFDRQPISSVRHFDDNGFMHVDVSNITKEQVAPYYGREIPGWEEQGLIPDKIYYGYRPFEELEKAKDTFNNLNLLSEHIEDGADKDVAKYKIGSLGTDAKADNPYLTNSLMIDDEKAIDDIKSGRKKELSSAYRYKPVFKTGFFDGQKYDFLMTNIRGNHVALVKEGRAGSDVVVADSNTICKGVKMTTNKIKSFLAKLTSSDKMAMDEDLEEAMKDAVKEAIIEVKDEVKKPEEEQTPEANDAESVDKRKLIDQVGGILKSAGVDDEVIRTVMQKMEEASYNDSEASADDACPQATDEEPKKPEDEEKKDDKPAMDAAAIRLSITNEFKQKNSAAQSVRSLIGNVDPLAFDSAEDIYAKALELNGYDLKAFPRASYRGMVEVLKKEKSNKAAMSFDSLPDDSLLSEFPELKNIKLGA